MTQRRPALSSRSLLSDQCKDSRRDDWRIGRYIEGDAFKGAMREVAGAVAIVTTGDAAGRRGLTATALCSLSADPPSILVCISKETATHEMIVRNGTFCVNMTASEHTQLALRFSGRDGVHGAEKFSEGRWRELVTGAPVLADAPVAFDCEVVSTVGYRTHSIFIGGVIASQVLPGRSALLYRKGAFAEV